MTAIIFCSAFLAVILRVGAITIIMGTTGRMLMRVLFGWFVCDISVAGCCGGDYYGGSGAAAVYGVGAVGGPGVDD